jgi:aldose 1-epimerase
MVGGQGFTLALDDQRATVQTRGGRVAAYRVGGRDVLAGTENPELFAFRGSLLAPWPNRVVGGRWAWEGRLLQLPVNDLAAGAALHGLVFDVEWSVTQVDAYSILLTYALPAHPGYPFRLLLTAAYALTPEGLTCSLTALNSGTEPAPVGLGVHPYIAAPDLVDDLMVTIPAARVLQTDATWQESGRPSVEDAGVDFRSQRRLGDLALDAAFTAVAHEGGRTEAIVGLPDGRQVVLWSGRTCRWWLLYTGHTLPGTDVRRSLALEPMTCPPNALNTGEIDVLAAGASLRLDWGVTVR